MSVPLPLAAAAVLIAGTTVWIATKPADVFAQGRSSYAEDRAAIEDLQARYLFALDFHDPDLYVSWLLTKRKIYNEGRDEWAYEDSKNPAW